MPAQYTTQFSTIRRTTCVESGNLGHFYLDITGMNWTSKPELECRNPVQVWLLARGGYLVVTITGLYFGSVLYTNWWLLYYLSLSLSVSLSHSLGRKCLVTLFIKVNMYFIKKIYWQGRHNRSSDMYCTRNAFLKANSDVLVHRSGWFGRQADEIRTEMRNIFYHIL